MLLRETIKRGEKLATGEISGGAKDHYDAGFSGRPKTHAGAKWVYGSFGHLLASRSQTDLDDRKDNTAEQVLRQSQASNCSRKDARCEFIKIHFAKQRLIISR